jgi:hypothetical protein
MRAERGASEPAVAAAADPVNCRHSLLIEQSGTVDVVCSIRMIQLMTMRRDGDVAIVSCIRSGQRHVARFYTGSVERGI